MPRTRCLLAAALSCALLIPATPGDAQPNILFIMADDLGWTDTSNALTTMGNPSDFYETPRLDLLAAEGMSFTNAYANQTCSPTRSAILSGAYAPRSTNTIYQVGSLNASTTSLLEGIAQGSNIPDATITHAETLQTAGYTTGYVGKFHVSASVNDILSQHGFDENYGGGTSGGPGDYHASGGTFGNPISASLDAFAADYTQAYVDANIKPYATNLASQQAAIDALVGTPKHLTDASADAAIAFMDANLGDPFFLQYSPHAVHTPVDVDQARSDLLAKYQTKTAGAEDDSAPYAALIEGLDQSVARLVDYLQTTPDPNNAGQTLDQNTLLIFYSDNGGGAVANNSPLTGQKSGLTEGGVRVPLIAWSANPSLVDGGTISDEVVVPVDFYATFASLAGAALPTTQTFDGVDLSGVFADASVQTGRDSVFWHFPGNLRGNQNNGPQSVIRKRIGQTDWKLTYSYEDQSWELYNLDDDIDESDNLAATESAIVQSLGRELLGWLLETQAPLATVRTNTIQVDLDGIVYGYADGAMQVYQDETLVFAAGEEMPLFVVGVGPGDMDGDNLVSNADIAPFVLALTDPEAYAAAFPGLDPDILGDLSGDGVLTNADIAGFVDALTGGGASLTQSELAQLAAVPEPASLVILGLLGLFSARRRQ